MGDRSNPPVPGNPNALSNLVGAPTTGTFNNDAASEYTRSRIAAAQSGMDPSNPVRPGQRTVTMSNAASPATAGNELTQEEIDYLAGLNPFAGATTEQIDEIVSRYVNTGGGGGSNTAAMRGVALDEQRYRDEQARLGQQAQGVRAQYANLQSQLGQDSPEIAALTALLGQQRTTARTDAEARYQTALDLLSGRRAQAEERTGAGYSALEDYLRTNPIQAYANAPQATAPAGAQNLALQYARAIGAPGEQIAAEAQAQQGVSEAGAANYNRLLNLLRTQETASGASRAAEAQQARTLSQAQLEALYGGATSGLEAQRESAITTALQEIAGREFGVEQQRAARNQALRDALNQLLASGYIQGA
jgi:hypothetical protein